MLIILNNTSELLGPQIGSAHKLPKFILWRVYAKLYV